MLPYSTVALLLFAACSGEAIIGIVALWYVWSQIVKLNDEVAGLKRRNEELKDMIIAGRDQPPSLTNMLSVGGSAVGRDAMK